MKILFKLSLFILLLSFPVITVFNYLWIGMALVISVLICSAVNVLLAVRKKSISKKLLRAMSLLIAIPSLFIRPLFDEADENQVTFYLGVTFLSFIYFELLGSLLESVYLLPYRRKQKQFYIQIDGVDDPMLYSYNDLNKMKIGLTTKVRRRSMDEFEPISLFWELRSLSVEIPPKIDSPHFGYQLATPKERLLGAIISLNVFALPLFVVIGGFKAFDLFSWYTLLVFVISSAVISFVFNRYYSGNIGHRVMHLKVISALNGRNLNKTWLGMLREMLKVLSTVCVLPVALLLVDKNRQNGYDKICKTYVIKRVDRSSNYFITWVTALLILTNIGFLVYTEATPLLAEYYLTKIPISADKRMGNKFTKDYLKTAPIDKRKTVALNKYFHELGFSEDTKLYVVKEKEFNAFATPNNRIFVYTGALNELQSSDQLSALLAHEYAHIKLRHAMRNKILDEGSSYAVKTVFGGRSFPSVILQISNEFLSLKYSRNMETEADLEGVELLRNHQLNTYGMPSLLDCILKLYGTMPAIVTPFSTHPDLLERVAVAKDRIENAPQNQQLDARPKLEKLFVELTKHK